MEVTLLFTASNMPGSWLIRNVTKEPLSHVGIQIGDAIIHSTILKGVTVDSYNQFMCNKTIVWSIPLNVPKDHLYEIPNTLGAKYDILGLLYLGLRYLIPILPKKNLWQMTGMFMCTEFVTDVINEKEDSMITPYGLYTKLKDKKNDS